MLPSSAGSDSLLAVFDPDDEGTSAYHHLWLSVKGMLGLSQTLLRVLAFVDTIPPSASHLAGRVQIWQ